MFLIKHKSQVQLYFACAVKMQFLRISLTF